MVQIKPNPENLFVCPECKAKRPVINDILFESINVLADCTCSACGFEFVQSLGVGHTARYPLSIGKDNAKLYDKNYRNKEWLSNSFLMAHKEKSDKPVHIERMVLNEKKRVIILNTLDSLYGHVLLKLYNAFYHLDCQKELGLIIIIPKIFTWLIPPGCAEVWIVDLKLSDFIYGYNSIQRFVQNEMERFDEVYVSNAYSHPNISAIDITRLTGSVPFDLNQFNSQRPTITFVLREDRWWLKRSWDELIYRVFRKIGRASLGKSILTLQQNQLVRSTLSFIRAELPDAEINIVGLGTTGTFDENTLDDRKNTITSLIEKNWCETYSRSHVIVGMHGSNMLIPTALAAGCVEILPEDRFGNIVQDISVRYTDRLQLFLYRFCDQYASPRSVAKKVIAMINDYSSFKENMCSNLYPQPFSMTPPKNVDDGRH